MNQNIRKLPDGELEVMQVIWGCENPVSRKEIEGVLSRERSMATTTLLTMLTRLAEKEFIAIEKNGRNSQYTAIISQQDYLASQSNRFIQKVCGGNLSAFAIALCDSGLSKEEIEELRELLREKRL